MCGIAGIVRYDRPALASRADLLAMRARLVHRGPDGAGFAAIGHAALGHTRLAMVDAPNGAQPMTDGRFTIVYNGELYNHHALRARLPGPWRTDTDTETVLAAWRTWGDAAIEQLDGMFAMFVWDAARAVGIAARDRLGVKPFAYAAGDALADPGGGAFVFASEAKALVPLLRSVRANRDAIVEYLVAPAFSGVARSPFEGVRYLPPGHLLRVSIDGLSMRRYWRWSPCAPVFGGADPGGVATDSIGSTGGASPGGPDFGDVSAETCGRDFRDVSAETCGSGADRFAAGSAGAVDSRGGTDSVGSTGGGSLGGRLLGDVSAETRGSASGKFAIGTDSGGFVTDSRGDVSPAELRALFDGAVDSACRADARLGVFLSGGLDSTAIAAVMARRAAAAQEPPVHAWSITFDGQAGWTGSRLVVSDDTPFARLAASELGLVHHEVVFDRPAVAAEIAAVARIDDALPAWEQELSQRALARAAAEHVKGVLVGDAADELHYGYHFLLDAASPREVIERLGSVPLRDPAEAERLVAQYDELADEGGVAGITRLVVERWLPRLLHNGDVHTMAFGLEARVPFAANRLVELAERARPDRAADKALVREALVGAMPEVIRVRRKSALPKDQAVGEIYRDLAFAIAREPHPIVRELVDFAALPLDERGVSTIGRRASVERGEPPIAGAPLDERDRARLFRVIALHEWACAYGVR